MAFSHRPLVLVHGLWNSPQLFYPLLKELNRPYWSVFIPHLPHDFGRTPLRVLAKQLDSRILEEWGPEVEIDLVGFSMGGIVSRIWLQELGGAARTNHFLSVGSPHRGTLTAQFVPSFLLEGIADMKCGSKLLKELNRDYSALERIKCSSFFCRWDLMVLPGWRAVLPLGLQNSLPVFTHKQLIYEPRSLKVLVRSILSE